MYVCICVCESDRMTDRLCMHCVYGKACEAGNPRMLECIVCVCVKGV